MDAQITLVVVDAPDKAPVDLKKLNLLNVDKLLLITNRMEMYEEFDKVEFASLLPGISYHKACFAPVHLVNTKFVTWSTDSKIIDEAKFTKRQVISGTPPSPQTCVLDTFILSSADSTVFESPEDFLEHVTSTIYPSTNFSVS